MQIQSTGIRYFFQICFSDFTWKDLKQTVRTSLNAKFFPKSFFRPEEHWKKFPMLDLTLCFVLEARNTVVYRFAKYLNRLPRSSELTGIDERFLQFFHLFWDLSSFLQPIAFWQILYRNKGRKLPENEQL